MKRAIDTSIWGDPWFTELSANGKMVFMYLLTNERSTAAGIFDLSPRRMAFDIGIDQSTAESSLEECSGRVRWWPEHSIVWVVNFFRHQAVNDNFLKSAQRTYAELPEDVKREVAETYPDFDANPYGTPTEPVPTGTPTHTHIAKSEELTASSDQGTEEVNAREQKPTRFTEFWQAYPKKVGKGAAAKAFKAVKWREIEFAVLMAALERQKQSGQWREENGRFIPNPATWLNQERWGDELPPPSTSISGETMTTAQRLALQAEQERAEYEQARSDRSDGNTQHSMAERGSQAGADSGLFLVAGRRAG